MKDGESASIYIRYFPSPVKFELVSLMSIKYRMFLEIKTHILFYNTQLRD